MKGPPCHENIIAIQPVVELWQNSAACYPLSFAICQRNLSAFPYDVTKATGQKLCNSTPGRCMTSKGGNSAQSSQQWALQALHKKFFDTVSKSAFENASQKISHVFKMLQETLAPFISGTAGGRLACIVRGWGGRGGTNFFRGIQWAGQPVDGPAGAAATGRFSKKGVFLWQPLLENCGNRFFF